MRRFIRILGTAAAAGAFVLLGAGAAAADEAAVQKGMKLYADQKCSICHSVEGKGNKKFPLDGVGSKLSAADLKMWLVDPAAMHAKQSEKPAMKMKSYKSLPGEDVDALVAYLQSLKKK